MKIMAALRLSVGLGVLMRYFKMGQARIRGTKEERIKQGIEKRCVEEHRLVIARDERDKQEQLIVAAMLPEQRQRMYKTRALVIGVSLAFGLDIKYDV